MYESCTPTRLRDRVCFFGHLGAGLALKGGGGGGGEGGKSAEMRILFSLEVQLKIFSSYI